jgi:hypothetical protein
MGMSGHRPGFNHIGKLQNAFLATYGTIDLDQGKVLVQPTYQQIGVITPALCLHRTEVAAQDRGIPRHAERGSHRGPDGRAGQGTDQA